MKQIEYYEFIERAIDKKEVFADKIYSGQLQKIAYLLAFNIATSAFYVNFIFQNLKILHSIGLLYTVLPLFLFAISLGFLVRSSLMQNFQSAPKTDLVQNSLKKKANDKTVLTFFEERLDSIKGNRERLVGSGNNIQYAMYFLLIALIFLGFNVFTILEKCL